MKLWEARVFFTDLISQLPAKAKELNLRAAFDEGFDRITEKDPTTDHMKGSLHEIGLAQDVLLYKPDGTYLTRTEDHQQLGEWWESLHPYCKWGGRFHDGNHYSFADPSLVGKRK